MKSVRDSVGARSGSVCLLGGPLNSYSTLGRIDVCRTITGLRQWRFCLTTIGGNTAAEKCVRNTSTDEPHEKFKKKGNGREKRKCVLIY